MGLRESRPGTGSSARPVPMSPDPCRRACVRVHVRRRRQRRPDRRVRDRDDGARRRRIADRHDDRGPSRARRPRSAPAPTPPGPPAPRSPPIRAAGPRICACSGATRRGRIARPSIGRLDAASSAPHRRTRSRPAPAPSRILVAMDMVISSAAGETDVVGRAWDLRTATPLGVHRGVRAPTPPSSLSLSAPSVPWLTGRLCAAHGATVGPRLCAARGHARGPGVHRRRGAQQGVPARLDLAEGARAPARARVPAPDRRRIAAACARAPAASRRRRRMRSTRCRSRSLRWPPTLPATTLPAAVHPAPSSCGRRAAAVGPCCAARGHAPADAPHEAASRLLPAACVHAFTDTTKP